jgi:hypothetical protein
LKRISFPIIKMSDNCHRNILQKALYSALSDWAKNIQYVSALVSGTVQINIQKTQNAANLELVEYDLNENAIDNCGVALPNNSSGGATIANPIVGISLGSCYNYDTGFLCLKFNPNGVSTIPSGLLSINNASPIIIGSIIFNAPTLANGAVVSLHAANEASLDSGMMEYLCAVPIYKTIFGNKYITGFNIALCPQGINAFMLATNTDGAVVITSSSNADIIAIATAAAVSASTDSIELGFTSLTQAILSVFASINTTMNNYSQANTNATAASIYTPQVLADMVTSASSDVYSSIEISAATIITNAITSAINSNPSLLAIGAPSAVTAVNTVENMINYAIKYISVGIPSAINDALRAIANGTISQGIGSTVYDSAVTNAATAIKNAIIAGYAADNPTATADANTTAANEIITTVISIIEYFADFGVDNAWTNASAALIAAQQAATQTNAETTTASATAATTTSSTEVSASSVLVRYELSYFDRELNMPSTCSVPMPTEASAKTATADATSGSGYNYLNGNIAIMINNVSTS